MLAKDVMTSPVITTTPDTLVLDVATLLLQHRISGVPVVDGDGRIVGIVSEGDFLHRTETGTDRPRSRWLEFLIGREGRTAGDFVKSHGLRVRDVMSRNVVSVRPDADLGEIAELMERKRIKRVPVVENDRPIGIVSRANLLHGLVAYKRSPAGLEAISAPEIRRLLVEKLRHEPWADLSRINIVVSDGTVHLWGIVTNDDQRRALRVAAEEIPGVKGVEEHFSPRYFTDG